MRIIANKTALKRTIQQSYKNIENKKEEALILKIKCHNKYVRFI